MRVWLAGESNDTGEELLQSKLGMAHKRTSLRWLLCLIALVCPLAKPRLFGQQPVVDSASPSQNKTVVAVRTTLPVQIDGDLSEAAWQELSPATRFVQAEPYEGEAATERTEVKVLYDDENLYIGVYCYDNDSARIMTNSLKRDFTSAEADAFEVILDTFRDARNGFLFITNPQGAKRDVQVSNEGRTQNVDWDTVWDVRSQVNGDGWTSEMMIPFKSLSFDEKQGGQLWGINFSRRIRRKNEIAYWAPVPHRYNISRVSLAGTLTGLEEIRRRRSWKVKPFGIAGVRKLSLQDSVEEEIDAGVDAKYSVTPGMTLDLTLNTDFSQVEVDEQQINLTRFPLFFPEKREFFLENSGVFQLGDIPFELGPARSRETQLFFSRRIGLSEDREPVSILGGARLSGQLGKFSLGLLNMQTQDADDGTPGSNFAVTRVKRDILANSDIGAIVVNRQGSERGDFNRTFGVDTNFRFWQNLTINGYLAKTQTDGLSGRDLARKVTGQWRDNLLLFQVVFSETQENFNPEVGFTSRPGVETRFIRNRIELRPRPPRNPIIREFQPHMIIRYFMDENNRIITKQGHYALQVDFHDGSSFEIFYAPEFDRLDSPFQIRPDFAIPVGDYKFDAWHLELATDPSKMLFGTLNFAKGNFYSGKRTSLTATGTFRPNYRFSVENRYSLNDVDLEEGSFTTHLVRSRINYYFSTRMFLSAFLQYNSDRNLISSNIRFNFIHRPLSDLFVVYNEDRDISGTGRTDRAFTVKYTHLISF